MTHAAEESDSLRQRMRAEQVALMCHLSTSPLLGSMLIAALMAYLTVEDFGPVVAIGWYIVSVVIVLVRLQIAQLFLSRPRSDGELRRWRLWMFVLIVTFGAVWSIPAGFLMPMDPQKETVMSILFIGASATGLGSLSAVRHAYAAFLIPLTLPFGIHQLLMGGDRVYVGLAFLLYLPVMIVIANRQTNSVERQLRLAVENETLASELRLQRDRANESNRELQTQVMQQRRAAERIRLLNGDLQSQAAELRAANNDLEGFCYSVSHDLRGPLRAIDGFTHLLDESDGGRMSAESAHSLERIRANVARMSMLIDDLLEFSRRGRQPIEKTDLNMQELARSAANEVLLTRAPSVHPDIHIEAMPAARGDRQLLLQVWVNLIDNAVKYSSKSSAPTIILRGREEMTRFVYEVVDNGVGFDNRYRNALFGVFQRLHGADEFPGTGVGLAIVHRIIVRHDGQVWANSGIAGGATFGFSLPKAIVPSNELAAV